MAAFKKFTKEAVNEILGHNNRLHSSYSNKDIAPEKIDSNFKFKLNHDGLSDYEYFKKIYNENYLYGRGTKREKDAVVLLDLVITLPSVHPYSIEEQYNFFNGSLEFIKERYGEENVISAVIHRDESENGQPHIHIDIVPSTNLDHEILHYKTKKTLKASRTESGRFEYEYSFVKDINGEKIPLKNYAKISDLYEKKIDANSVLNRVELQHFHEDFDSYLYQKLGYKTGVVNGSTGGINLSVDALKEFTNLSGLTLDQLQGTKIFNEIYEEISSIKNENKILRDKLYTMTNDVDFNKTNNHTINVKEDDILW